MRHHFVIDMQFACSGSEATDQAFDDFTDRVLNELYALEEADEGIIDPDITASLTDRTISVIMGIEADTHSDARRLFLANVRTALHGAQCHTAGWHVLTGEAGSSKKLPPARDADHVAA